MDFDVVRRNLAGVIPITLTPFTEAGEIDEPAFERVIRRLVDGGITALTVNGNTSEFYTLSPAEARRGVELTTRTVDPDVVVIVGVGLDVQTAIHTSHQAADLGAAAVMVHQSVHPYVSNEGWVEYHRVIAHDIPELAVIPYVRNAAIRARDFMSLADQCANVLGVKYAVADVTRFATVSREVGERLIWIDGLAELVAPSYFAVGAVGFTSGLANVAPQFSLGMHAALRRGDYTGAMRLWDLIREFEDMRLVRSGADNVSVIKEALHQLGVCGPGVRAPSTQLCGDDRRRVTHILTTWGIDS